MVSNQAGLREPIDGILGLARNKPFYLSKKDNRGPSYMMGLYNAGLVSENIFSFKMSP